MFSPSFFLANPLKLCAVNQLNTWELMVFIFVEFLSSYRRIQNVGLRSPPQMRTRNARITSYSWCAGGLLEADTHVGL
jgi:hypothetical protein